MVLEGFNMTKLKEIQIIIDALEKEKDSLRHKLAENVPVDERYVVCIHDNSGLYYASIWSNDRSFEEEDYYSTVTYNDIKSGSKVFMEQDEYCQKVQIYLGVINEL